MKAKAFVWNERFGTALAVHEVNQWMDDNKFDVSIKFVTQSESVRDGVKEITFTVWYEDGE